MRPAVAGRPGTPHKSHRVRDTGAPAPEEAAPARNASPAVPHAQTSASAYRPAASAVTRGSPYRVSPKLRCLPTRFSCLTRPTSPTTAISCSQEFTGVPVGCRARTLLGCGLTGQSAAMHVTRIRSSQTGKDGERREYESRLLRRTYRDDGKVRHETLAIRQGRRTAGGHGRAVGAARARRCRPRDGPQARAARPARPGRPPPRLRARADRVEGGAPRLEAVHAGLVGRRHPRPPTSGCPAHRRIRPTRRWTGCRAARSRSRGSSPPATSPPR